MLKKNSKVTDRFYPGAIAMKERRPKYKTRLQSEYRRDKWEFIVKGQDWVKWRENHKEETWG